MAEKTKTAVITSTQQQKEIVAVQKDITKIARGVEGFRIRSPKDLDFALEQLQLIKVQKKSYKERIEDGIIKPIKTGLDNLKALVQPIKDALEQAEDHIKTEVGIYNAKLREEEDVKKAKIEEKLENEEISFERASAQIEKVESKRAEIPTFIHRSIVVEDESQVPDIYWKIDEVKLRTAALAAADIGQTIPGVKVVSEERIANR